MFIWRNVDPKVLMTLLLAASRIYRKKTPASRLRAPGEAGRIARFPDDDLGRRPHRGSEERHV